MAVALLVSVFVIATCGLIYELVAGTLASYLLGDSVMQFSTVIGTYLFSMGIGSLLSRFIQKQVIGVFIRVELLIALVGGFSASLLFVSFAHVQHFQLLLYATVFVTGTLVGLEIPLLMRLLKDRFEFKDLVSHVFTFDYIGALAASLLFPLFLVPYLGLIRTGLFFGLLNAGVAVWALWLFRDQLKNVTSHYLSAAAVCVLLVFGFVYADRIQQFSETSAFAGQVIYARSSPYQRVVLTRDRADLRLYLNGNLQFSSLDEYRYHEALVHPGMSGVPRHKNILVLGGGDGLAVRELLRYPGVASITLVDLDPLITELFRNHQDLRSLNRESLLDARVKVVNEDAFQWARNCRETFDFIVVDFPDPNNFSLGKLYTITFYEALAKLLAPGGQAAIQCTSPLVARQSYWCVNHTLRAAGLHTAPYHAYVPSFGEWGFILAAKEPLLLPRALPAGLRYLNAATLPQLFLFPPDMDEVPTEVNALNNQVLVQYFEKEWATHAN